MADRPTSAGAVLTELDTDEIGFLILAELQFSDGTVNLWLGPKDATLSYLSKTWTGTGDLGGLETIEETEGVADKPLVATLHATLAQIDSIELAANEGRQATFYVVLYNLATGAIIGHIEEPREMGKAWIEPKLEIKKDSRLIVSDIKMEFIGEGAIMKRSHRRFLTYTDGLELDNGDHFLEFAGDPDQSKMAGSQQLNLGPVGTGPRTRGPDALAGGGNVRR